ncbi:MAG: hypothetical protein U5L98_02120 [Halomonas sp.]|nr:hypothetical protein [Halomonas sp.]MDZ7851461.1 hypothetical protein [Halomonas sp.]
MDHGLQLSVPDAPAALRDLVHGRATTPGYHYVQLKDDYSDLDDKIAYYEANPEEAKAIILQANRYVATFRDTARERLIGLLVLQKYFIDSGQLSMT